VAASKYETVPVRQAVHVVLPWLLAYSPGRQDEQMYSCVKGGRCQFFCLLHICYGESDCVMFPAKNKSAVLSTRSRAYHALIRAQEICQMRIKRIEIELTDAFNEISVLKPHLLSYESRTAVCMALHPRLGAKSSLGMLPDDILCKITQQADEV